MSLFSRQVYSRVERQRRGAARLALYSSLVLVGLAGWAGARLVESPTVKAREQAWNRVDYKSLPEVQLLSQYVQIDTSPITGNEIPGARFLEQRLRAAGIPSTVDLVDDRHANLWAIIEGENPDAVVLHSHIDVTSPDMAQWDFPPFDGLIDPPWIRGRGTFDMKSIAIAQLMAMTDLAAEVAKTGRRPKRSVIFLATSSEEHGSAAGMRRILDQHPELVRRFAVMITEGGAVEARSLDDIKYWGTEFAQRREVEVVTHAATAAPLDRLRDALGRQNTTKPRLGPEAAAFLGAYGGSRDSVEIERAVKGAQHLVEDPAALAAAPALIRDLLVDQAFVATATADPEGGFRMPLTFMLLPDSDWDAVRAELLPAALTAGIQVTGGPAHGLSRGSSLEHPAYRAMQSVLSEAYPHATIGPHMLSFTLTDSRFVRALGIPSYGFSPFLILSIDTYRVDRMNERIGLPGYVSGVSLYRKLVTRLANDASGWN
ncbi:MAG: M20/M25/M40 family metallo-hydrolase [Acidobacteriota bacterium]